MLAEVRFGKIAGALHRSMREAADYGLDTRETPVELGRRRMVGGQGHMIVDVALDLGKLKDRAAEQAGQR